jgi:hypothetical protein
VTGDWTGRVALAALLILGFTESVSARPGDGIRVGGSTGRLHPYFEVETRYDSNVAFDEQARSTSGFILHLRPGLTLDAPGDLTAVSLKANLDWAQYLGGNSGLSRLFGEAQLGLGFNRRGALGLELTDAFRRSTSTTAFNLGGAVVSNSNQLQVSVPFRPGGGAFVTTLTGGWDLETFDPFDHGQLCTDGTPACNQDQLAKLGYSDVSGKLELKWKFLPRTAALLQGEYWKRLPSDSKLGSDASGLRAWGGLAGLFGAHLAGTVKAGYGSISNSPSSTSTWLANVEAEWLPLETTSLKLGYLHDLGLDPGRDAGFTSHRLYLHGGALMAGRYSGEVDASYEHRSYSAADVTADLFQVSPTVGVELARWLQVAVGLSYTKRTSALPTGAGDLPGFNFDKTEAFLRVRGTY